MKANVLLNPIFSSSASWRKLQKLIIECVSTKYTTPTPVRRLFEPEAFYFTLIFIAGSVF
jgi:hypothetical protein